MKTSIINGSEVSRLSVAIHLPYSFKSSLVFKVTSKCQKRKLVIIGRPLAEQQHDMPYMSVNMRTLLMFLGKTDMSQITIHILNAQENSLFTVNGCALT